LIAAELLLAVAERWGWARLSERKGWSVLIGIAAVGAALALMGVWFALALLFRRRFQFSVRSLLLLTVALAIPSGWLATSMGSARQQRQAVGVVCAGGGTVCYDFEADADLRPVPGARPREPMWLRNLFGDDFFHEVVSAEVQGASHTEGAYLASLPRLRRLHTGLLTDDEIQDVAALAELENLDIGSCPHRRDAGLRCVEGLTRLKELYVWYSAVGNAGFEHVAGLKQLERLNAMETRVGDAGVRHLRGLDNLEHLELHGSPITDKGLEDIGALGALRRLSISGEEISDAGLEHLRGLTHLRSLGVVETWAMPEGVARLQTALPRCKIEYREHSQPQREKREPFRWDTIRIDGPIVSPMLPGASDQLPPVTKPDRSVAPSWPPPREPEVPQMPGTTFDLKRYLRATRPAPHAGTPKTPEDAQGSR
jgi:hypothetical protein